MLDYGYFCRKESLSPPVEKDANIIKSYSPILILISILNTTGKRKNNKHNKIIDVFYIWKITTFNKQLKLYKELKVSDT